MKRQPTGRGPEPRAGRVLTKPAEYVGSFAVEDTDLPRAGQAVHQRLQLLKDCPRRRSVLLRFCLQGLKMLGRDGEAPLMAHALKRLAYSTCRPADRQFAFLARNPRGARGSLFCHLFVGSQPGEVQALHYLLCRFFQLGYLLLHPEEQDWSSSGGSAQRDSGKHLGVSLDSQVVWESLNPEEVSQNVNALVSFRRLPCPTEFGTSVSVRERLDLEESSSSSVSSARPGNPYCSPILVRKKAIRSKILRSGAYRGCTFEAASQQGAWEGFSSSCDGKANLLHLPENENDLRESVWSFAGINRDAGLALLRNDMLGAFLLWAESGSTHQWCLAVRTRCGVVPYQIYRSQLGKYSVEHLNIEFPSMEVLLDNYSGVRAGLFCSLGAGRINHCYEEQDDPVEDLWGEERTRRKSSWLFGASRSLAVQHEVEGCSAGSFS
ncbi:SH2 domain-containing protein 5 isoform X1 [Pantherophis guttatus]|uniref:SH2 domain-containing protein 5 isoform X1 n=1 Tax=Pantherophis guttatus TaxID=94885 RepID=A0A6P9AX13_PANGU|nr:SH2 domain-containing protein 5 isoform X1 [Pantherophis guttatus]